MPGVVVRKAREVEAVVGELVPLFASDLAGLASDAERGVGEEALHRYSFAGSCCSGCCLNGRSPTMSRGGPSSGRSRNPWTAARRKRPRRPGRMSAVRAFDSWMCTFGSATKARRSFQAARIALLPIEQVLDHRLFGFVVCRKRTVEQARRRVQPALPVDLEDERIDAGDRVQAGGAEDGPVRRRPIGDEVRVVVAGPLLRLLVPPDVSLAFAPGLSVRGRGSAVVENSAVVGPCPSPVGRNPVLLARWLATRRLVDAIRVHAGVDPAAAGGAAVALELRVFLQRLAGDQVAAVDLREDRLRVEL